MLKVVISIYMGVRLSETKVRLVVAFSFILMVYLKIYRVMFNAAKIFKANFHFVS